MARSSIVILTGAGVSAPSGIPTFRDKGGLWRNHRLEDLATPAAFTRNPAMVHEFYNMRRTAAAKAKPNLAHLALARLEQNWDGPFLLVTQNVDDLHEAAGSSRIRHIHGNLKSALCTECKTRSAWNADLDVNSCCPSCSSCGFLRPDIVWFGEIPYHLEEVGAALAKADLFLAIGTSGSVYPAAGFASVARSAGAKTILINSDQDTRNMGAFDEFVLGDASVVLRDYVDVLLNDMAS